MVATVLTAAELCEQAIDRDLLIVPPKMSVGDVMKQMSPLRSLPSLSNSGQPKVNPADFVATRCALVIQDCSLVGIFTTQDIVRLHNQHLLDCNCPIADVMTTPVVTLARSELANPFSALTLLHQHHIRHLPILSHTQAVIGLVTTESMLQFAESLFFLQEQVIQLQTTQRNAQIAQEARDRERADAALKQSEGKFQALIEALPDLIMRLSRNGTYLDFFPSRTFKILPGAERVGRTLWDGCLPVELAEQRMYYIQRALQDKALQIYEQHILIDDKLRTEEVRVVVCGEDEVLLIVRDITERKEAEDALIQLNQDLENKIKHRTKSLKESEERFRQIFEQSPLGIAITDLDGDVMRANSRLTATLGYAKPSEVLGLSIQDLLCFEPSADGVLPLQQLLEQTLSVISFESKPVTKDGKTLWVNVTSALIFSSNFPSGIIHLVEDITERKQIDNQLRNLSDRLSLAVQAGEVGIWEWNAITNELVWDERMLQLYGIQPSDFTGIYFDWLSRVHPEDQQKAQAEIEKALQGEQEFAIEFRIRHADGTIRFIKAGGLIERTQQGQPQRMIGVNFDITKHKQAQAVISQYAREVEDLYNHAPCGYHSLDSQGRIIKINNTALQWLGLRRDEVLGKSFEEFLTEDSAQIFREHYPIFKRQGAIQDIELDLVCSDRTIFPVLLNATAVRDQDGTYLYSRSTLFDHRKLKAATTSLKRQLVAIEAAIDGIAILAASKYTYLNQAHLKLFGYEHLDELIGKSWTLLYLPEEIRRFEQEVFPQLHTYGFWQGEAQAVRKDSSTFVEGLSLTLTESGEIICVCRNITEQKHAEVQLQQINERLTLTNTELYRATRLRDEFLANMSHELRTPLNVILGMSESLQEKVFGIINQQQEEAINMIVQSGSHLLELINDILDLSKAEASKLELQLTPTPISELCHSSLGFVKHQARQKNLKLIAQIPSALPDIVVDERRIRQVLINLLTNAVKFTPNDGTIQLVVQREYQAGQPLLCFSVIDTGIGIAPDNLDHLFQPFSQIDSSLNRRYAGTGLGLALVRRLIELHHGRVDVTSTLGHGSCFTICLPYKGDFPVDIPKLQSSGNAVAPPTSSALPPSNVITDIDPTLIAQSLTAPLILLAEDNEANIATITSYLNARGYQTVLARTGKEAVEIAQARSPNLILMDIQMPEMNGLDAMQQIRANRESSHIPIIALTALAMVSDRDKCLAAGADDYCTKPIKLKQLIATIRSLLNREIA